MSRPRRERRSVTAVEAVGPYALIRRRARRARPGQSRVSSSCSRRPDACCRVRCRCASRRAASSRSCSTRSARGRARSPGSSEATGSTSSGRSATASGSTCRARCSSAAGSAIAPLPYLSEALERPPAVLGFRSEHHAEAAVLVPNAEVVIDPVLVTEAYSRTGGACSRAGPSRCSRRCARSSRRHSSRGRRRWPAGYGACYGCVVEIDGELKRLCVEGPVLCFS